ncbi:MAG: hypothetical protein AAF513_02455 [Pseudomonadota bacterium]
MHLGDFLTGYSLELNNRCLLYLADIETRAAAPTTADPVAWQAAIDAEISALYQENTLVRDTRRLLSLWALNKNVLRKMGQLERGHEISRHMRALRRVASIFDDGGALRRLTLRLATLAPDDDTGESLVLIARQLPAPQTLGWDELSNLYGQDSRLWRCLADDPASDRQLQRKIVKSYKRARRANHAFAAGATGLDELRLYVHWCAHAACQLELLRPVLSDQYRSMLWHLEKLSDAVRTGHALQSLGQQAHQIDVKPAAVAPGFDYIAAQSAKMRKRVTRLADDAFACKPKQVRTLVERSVERLGQPRAVTTLPGSSSREPGADGEPAEGGGVAFGAARPPLRAGASDRHGQRQTVPMLSTEHRGDAYLGEPLRAGAPSVATWHHLQDLVTRLRTPLK